MIMDAKQLPEDKEIKHTIEYKNGDGVPVELIAFDRVLTDKEVNSIQKYLMDKYEI